jgi:hypothetical protein
MFDDLAAYYHENVVSAFIDYREIRSSGTAGRSRDVRGALIAATALFHLREHLPRNNQLTRSDAEKLCPDYGLLGDIVNAAKHKSVSAPTPHGAPLVADATQIGEQIVLTEYQDEEGTYRCTEKTVIAKLSDGSERNLLEVLTNVMNFWEQHLHSLGVISSARTFTYANNVHPRSRAECEANRLNFEIVQGQRFHQSMRLQRFNYQTGMVEPIDLTGSQLKFSIYRPRYDIDLSLAHNASGAEFKRTITLSEDESETVSCLTTDAERQAYIDALPSAQEAMRQLAIEAGLVKDPPSAQVASDEEDI